MVLDGAMSANALRADVQPVLVPTLTSDNIVVMDNVSAHKTPRGARGD